ncbi:hypothetical protein EKM01_03770 [Flavobacterium sp. RSP46]|uniref:hypothetical protein n=1 Tax=Flavobacterium sp. RSP46 TaxID=2497486 RepID=UPI000F892D96|nr:hypothetical protein [Flavobacterium sp. RSP46]RTY93227.1 hypothetical protein EKM01_03770 [Flavobacterium sp. RSP46]
MKNLILYIALLICSFTQAQNIALIERMQAGSLSEAKQLTSELLNLNETKLELVKEKQTKEAYILFYLPAGLTAEQKESAAVDAYESGVVVRLSKQNDNSYKLKEFYADPKLMFAIVNDVFYPMANYNDFIVSAKYRDYIDIQKKHKFYFYSGDSLTSKYRFYSY